MIAVMLLPMPRRGAGKRVLTTVDTLKDKMMERHYMLLQQVSRPGLTETDQFK